MPYERLNLVDGEVLTAEHIAHMESGMGSGYQRLNLVDGEVLTAGHISHMEDGIIAAQSGGGGSGGGSTEKKDVIFIDYDGTILHSYTMDEAQSLTELPHLPSHAGLICQGWNFDLEAIKSCDVALVVGATYITDDGTTRIYITLNEGRTSPMLGVCPNGTVTVDWGDGTAPDVLTGTSVETVQWTPNHEYAKPGDYVVRLTVNGEMGFYGTSYPRSAAGILRYKSNDDNRNYLYRNCVQKIEIGSGVTLIGSYSFYECNSVKSIVIPNSVTSIDWGIFYACNSLGAIVIPNSITTTTTYMCYKCYSLVYVSIPNHVDCIDRAAFDDCKSLVSITIPDSVTSINTNAFSGCYRLASIDIPASVKTIGKDSFYQAYGMRKYDFTKHTTIPTLIGSLFCNDDSEIRVPAALYDEWIAAENWSTYASQIVAV